MMGGGQEIFEKETQILDVSYRIYPPNDTTHLMAQITNHHLGFNCLSFLVCVLLNSTSQ